MKDILILLELFVPSFFIGFVIFLVALENKIKNGRWEV